MTDVTEASDRPEQLDQVAAAEKVEAVFKGMGESLLALCQRQQELTKFIQLLIESRIELLNKLNALIERVDTLARYQKCDRAFTDGVARVAGLTEEEIQAVLEHACETVIARQEVVAEIAAFNTSQKTREENGN